MTPQQSGHATCFVFVTRHWHTLHFSSTSCLQLSSFLVGYISQSREARRGKVELDLFQVDKESKKEVNTDSALKSSVTLDLFEAKEKKEDPKEDEERGAVNLNLFVNKTRRRNIDRDSKAFALISQNPSGNWVQRDSSKNKVLTCF